MGWVKQSDERPDHPKLLEAGPLATHLDDVAIMWSNRNRMDGRIPRRQVRRLVDWEGVHYAHDGGKPKPVDPYELAQILVEVGRWETIPNGWQIHDYLDHQASANEIEKQQEENRRRQREWRERQKQQQANAEANGGVAA